MFDPRLDILPEPQQALWPQLAALPEDVLLYGGTALAVRLGHRISVDFDFFSAAPLDKIGLRSLPFMADLQVLQDDKETLVGLVGPYDRSVKISFFGGIQHIPVVPPDWTSDGVVRVASLEDVLGFKLKALFDRAEGKDYQDIAAILASGVTLPAGMEVAIRVFGAGFPVSQALKAIVYDADLHEPWRVTPEARMLLRRAVAEFPLDFGGTGR